MKRKLYGNTVSPACQICIYGRMSVDDEVVLCPKKGVTDPADRCRHFSYDPLRRIPYRQPSLHTFTESDFSLDDLPE